ncbi:hypothetical protein ZWY2020_042461 [Hordeum vulgare]|nr:hypothetical protein ZWY2020_042461 [Hordeum vulgare]
MPTGRIGRRRRSGIYTWCWTTTGTDTASTSWTSPTTTISTAARGAYRSLRSSAWRFQQSSTTQFAAVGSSIVATSTSITRDREEQDVSVGGVLIYDTKTAAQVVSAYLPKSLLDGCGYTAAIPAGDRLYFFESCGFERYYKYVGHGKTILPRACTA